MLIPMALGLTSLVQWLEQRRWAVAGGIIALICLAEQGVTTETFDAVANRAAIERLARHVDRDRLAFYYHRDDLPFCRYQLDAMWASLVSGVPTINGYSGYVPRAWRDFVQADLDLNPDVVDVLSDWERTQGLAPDRVQSIGTE